jgi:hypothetical protein
MNKVLLYKLHPKKHSERYPSTKELRAMGCRYKYYEGAPKKYLNKSSTELSLILKQAAYERAKADFEMTQFTFNNYKRVRELSKMLDTRQIRAINGQIMSLFVFEGSHHKKFGEVQITEIANNKLMDDAIYEMLLE